MHNSLELQGLEVFGEKIMVELCAGNVGNA